MIPSCPPPKATHGAPGTAVVLLLGLALAACESTGSAPTTEMERETALLLPPPTVPPTLTRDQPARIVVELETNEQTWAVTEGVDYTF